MDITLAFFGGIFLIGLLLYLLARFTRNLFTKTLGQRAEIFLTAWIGTPVHELGHAFFCVIFGHHIKKIRLFTPVSKNGALGYVEHSFNKKNLYQRAGSFFIGAGPIIFGSFIILLLLYFMLPNGADMLRQLRSESSFLNQDNSWQGYLSVFRNGFSLMWNSLFSAENISLWQFWLFLYLALSIAAHMELSPPDIREMWSGFLVIILVLLVICLVYAFLFPDSPIFLYSALPAFNFLNQILFIALLLSLLNFFITWSVLNIYSLVFRKKTVSPLAK